MAKKHKKVKKKVKKTKHPKKTRKKALKTGAKVHVRGRSPDAKKPLNRRFGREILLNDEMLAKMILLWRYGIKNLQIAGILGIGITALRTWVRDNRPVEVTIFDDPLNHPKTFRKVIVGLKDLMEHEQENLKATYIQRLELLIEEATDTGDLKTASANLRWIMEKMLPHVFGDPKNKTDDDSDLPKRVKFPLKPPSLD